jgi:tetratricopeptide (TPR) repeat protein
MSVFNADQEPRRVIPRWRDSRAAVKTGELVPVPIRDPERVATGADEELAKHVDAWQTDRTVGNAADLLSAAIVLDRPRSAEKAAEYLIDHRSAVGDIAYRLARLVLSGGPAAAADSGPTPLPRGSDAEVVHVVRDSVGVNVRRLRQRLRTDPRNAIAWLDLSRQYARVGLVDQAARAIRTAVSLAPDHRFTLRSAARFFVHNEEPDTAQAILRRSAATVRDPWLLAAEVAVATVIGRTSTLIRPARALLASRGFPPFQITELAGALGTVEASDGHRKPARRFFALALEDPTENTVAQAQWTARHTGLIEFKDHLLDVPRSYEARAWGAYAGERWEDAVSAAWKWFEDEPFAGRPAELGASIAAVALEDGGAAVHFAKLAALANPTSPRLRSNEVFALTHAGRLDDAIAAYLDIDSPNLSVEERVVWLANGGMLGYRVGDQELGRNGYRAAVTTAKSIKNPTLEAAALVYWAAEALRSKTESAATGATETRRGTADIPADESAEALVKRAHAALAGPKVRTADTGLAQFYLRRMELRAATASSPLDYRTG